MSENFQIEVEADVFERTQHFKKVFAETQTDKEDVTVELTANSILLLGLDLMLVQFFEQIDDVNLQKSLAAFYQRYPHCQPVERLHRTSNELADLHIALSNRYPKAFFEFMLDMLKATEWAKARERFEQLFRKPDRNGDS